MPFFSTENAFSPFLFLFLVFFSFVFLLLRFYD